ncbi:MAG: aminotransferase class V-fold PLP-dependent enzyme [Ornithinimicrobium sp.]
MSSFAAAFAPAPGYVNASTLGLASIAVVEAMQHGLTQWQAGAASPVVYDAAVASARASFADLVGMPIRNVSVGPAASIFAGVVAASLPDGARVVAVADDFTSILFPFMVQEQTQRGVSVELVALSDLAGATTTDVDLVVFSLAQSRDGALVDLDRVLDAAQRAGARTFCDLTQAAGWLSIDAARFDMTVCSAYKWLCQPRGAAYFTVRDDVMESLTPVNAGWYAGESVWDSVYGPAMHLASDARRFDVSPSWLTWVGAAAAGPLFADDPIEVLGAHSIGLANDLRSRLGLVQCPSPVISLADPGGMKARACVDAGVTAASRAGALRIGFHLWNTTSDVDLVESALR